MTKAIFAGSFDPFHEGHMNIIERASKMYNQLFVVVANNEYKDNQTPIKERFCKLKKVTMPKNVMILMLPKGLLTTLARQMHIDTLVRGYRDEKDLVFEKAMAKKNRKYQSHIKTVFLKAEDKFKNIKSSTK